jgi:hypothetical protein
VELKLSELGRWQFPLFYVLIDISAVCSTPERMILLMIKMVRRSNRIVFMKGREIDPENA